MRTRIATVLALLVIGSSSVRGIQTEVDFPAIDEALRLGRSAIATERTRFHQAYRLVIGRAPVDYIELVTPFRRIVLAAQERIARGETGFGQRQALEVLSAGGSQLDAYVELTFHPLNTYIGVPEFTVAMTSGTGPPVAPTSIDRLSRWTPRLEGLPPSVPAPGGIPGAPRSQPLLGGTLIVRFPLTRLDAKGTSEVIVGEGGKELARARVDLGRLR